MNPLNVLVIYKKSLYQIYVLERKNRGLEKALCKTGQLCTLKDSHVNHTRTLTRLVSLLRRMKIKHRVIYRARHFNYIPFNLIVSVGGDGTLLEAARHATQQLIIGINSDPKRSIGAYCIRDWHQAKLLIGKISLGQSPVVSLRHRLQLWLNGKELRFRVLNDILICSSNPAEMSRYRLRVGKISEDQRSSGIWVSTASGSTGAIRSAGGRILSKHSKQFQYKPRELYKGCGTPYHLQGGLCSKHDVITIQSLMRKGMIYIDGAHFKLPFSYGSTLQICQSPDALHVILPS